MTDLNGSNTSVKPPEGDAPAEGIPEPRPLDTSWRLSLLLLVSAAILSMAGLQLSKIFKVPSGVESAVCAALRETFHNWLTS